MWGWKSKKRVLKSYPNLNDRVMIEPNEDFTRKVCERCRRHRLNESNARFGTLKEWLVRALLSLIPLMSIASKRISAGNTNISPLSFKQRDSEESVEVPICRSNSSQKICESSIKSSKFQRTLNDPFSDCLGCLEVKSFMRMLIFRFFVDFLSWFLDFLSFIRQKLTDFYANYSFLFLNDRLSIFKNPCLLSKSCQNILLIQIWAFETLKFGDARFSAVQLQRDTFANSFDHSNVNTYTHTKSWKHL